jgi:hypothetical protein
LHEHNEELEQKMVTSQQTIDRLNSDKKVLMAQLDEATTESQKNDNRMRKSQSQIIELNDGVTKAKDLLKQEEEKRIAAEASLVTANAQNDALELIIQQLCQTFNSQSSKLVPVAADYAQTIKNIIEVLGLSESDDIVARVKQLYDTTVSNNAEIISLRDFITQIINVITSTQSHIAFPMSQDTQTKVITIISKNTNLARADRETIHKILRKASSIGYKGSDAYESIEYIADYRANEKAQETIIQIREEIAEARKMLEKEVENRKKDNEHSKKKLAKAHNDLIEAKVAARDKEAALLAQNEQAETRIREIEEKCRIERQLREEITRIGQGATADMHLIKAKLSDQEFSVIELFKALIDKDRKDALIRENMRKTREELLGK